MDFSVSAHWIGRLLLAVVVLVGDNAQSRPPGDISRPSEDVAEAKTAVAQTESTNETTQSVKGQKADSTPVGVSGVVLTPESFNPSAGQVVTFTYRLSAASGVGVKIYGPNRELIREFPADSTLVAGNHRLTWDGRDSAGNIVRDEAYFFVIEAATSTTDDNAAEPRKNEGQVVARYDPLESSGGELVNPQEFHFKPQENSIEYVLPRPCRVRIRAGVDEGPMLSTMVNWEPRIRGLCTEVWRGKDGQGVRHFSTRSDCFLTSMAYALPENSVIAYGNKKETYREWYLREGHKRPKKPHTPRSPEKPGVMCPHWYMPPHLNRDPEILVTFPEFEQKSEPKKTDAPPSAPLSKPQKPGGSNPAPGQDAPPASADAAATPEPPVPPLPPTPSDTVKPKEAVRLSGESVILRVTIPDDAERRFMDEQKFEMVLFVDDQRILESEQSHVPFNWRWDLTNVPPGKHYLTVNLVTANDHVGTYTVPVEIIKEPVQPPAPKPEPAAGPPPE